MVVYIQSFSRRKSEVFHNLSFERLVFHKSTYVVHTTHEGEIHGDATKADGALYRRN
jgi:hypothetical protein